MASKSKIKSEGELAKEVAQKREELRSFRFQVAGGRVKNIKEGRLARRDIARMLTELRVLKIQAKI
ncbi:MAG: 50S ribosomal protein L29 [Candidatus Vogelbacteria bacterium CG10_big_fil_rev_8_21_14_0_10_51_16]|uniref:Large ribosomal subunit protein uL29 n=1 Tax=Candidatus Vogelbacteria bacterium CG10_big_fil_rev_8_21_14_0_10_51_16 TaxID=1975045 RepID=A0A2H0RFG6_9BACT|nr:MAG: 50S ribosomal protein L29 [Candidatus Vogelbacteria bacterium CG10_big_fil_rev_8_21_14_0_10_51_16]